MVAYTGTHDNDTTVGWWNSTAADRQHPHARPRWSASASLQERISNSDGSEIHWTFIRTLLASVADTAIVPLQDVLGLGNEARMNLPGSTKGNWSWRFQEDDLQPWMVRRLKQLTVLFDR